MPRLAATLVTCALMCASHGQAQADAIGHLRLKDRLDRSVDGYCLDVLGVGQSLRVDVPIFAHNCKPQLTPDSAVRKRADGKLVFPVLELCVTAFGVNGRALPGVPMLLRRCDDRQPFFESGPLQTFDFGRDGRITLRGTNLCLAVGAASDVTYSMQDRWRVLSVEDCAQTSVKYITWEFNTGPFPTP